MNNKRYFLGNGITFDALKREIKVNKQLLRLGGRESEILKLLCENPNMVLTKEDIHIKIWGSIYVSETSLTKAISNLRKALSAIEDLCFEIKTIPKEGYILISDSITAFLPEDSP
ncbi:winged helix-turn-helix domain-containing protein, partial [Vibrio cholerae]|nr:winged helix-turn-helix domain-containing protein [Vibrio cholerae]